jgi:hypothetical protein
MSVRFASKVRPLIVNLIIMPSPSTNRRSTLASRASRRSTLPSLRGSDARCVVPAKAMVSSVSGPGSVPRPRRPGIPPIIPIMPLPRS